MLTAIKLLNTLLAAGMTSVVWAVLLRFNPAGLAPAMYIERQQSLIRALNVPIPLLGALTILVTLTGAFLIRDSPRVAALLVAAALCFVAAGLITRFGNQTINAVVINWAPSAPPAEWTTLRDAWWRWHLMRTLATTVGFALLIIAYFTRFGLGHSAQG